MLGYIIVTFSIYPSITIFMGNPSAIGAIISLVCGACLIFADSEENPSYYYPYLICAGISLVVMILFVFFAIVQINTTISVMDDKLFFGSILLLIYLFTIILHSYFWYVVKRAKDYMENEICARKIPPPPGYVQAVIIEKV
uniref:Uncharacterized protein n=1 Tax=Panagrolaimus sp. JU765 TaxID=591449 RepID=A0AC34Q3S0_9BILA